MPSLGRGLSTGGTGALLASPRVGPGAAVASSLFWGPELTATVDSYTRIRLDVYWPGVRDATITRVDADGTTSPVRNAEPLLLNTQAVVYDHEAPLDQESVYRISPADDAATYLESEPVTAASGDSCGWLKHPFKPYLNRPVELISMGPRRLPARRGVARPIDRPDPIVVYQVRSTDSGVAVIRTADDWDDALAIREMLADGAPLLLQQPGSLGGESLYISVDDAALALLESTLGVDLSRDITIPFDVVARPPGPAGGPYGVMYDDVSAAYLTYEHVAAGEASYNDLAAAPGP